MKPLAMVFGLGLLMMSAPIAQAEPGEGRETCATLPPSWQGPIVNGRQRQPTQHEFEARLRELQAQSRAGPCAAPARRVGTMPDPSATPALGEAERPSEGP